VVLDDTALLALGSGSRLMSGLVVAACGDAGRFVYAPAVCLAAAVSQRPALAAHVGALQVIEVLDLGFAQACAAGVAMAAGAGWQFAQAAAAASPTPEWPRGLPVVTAEPARYVGSRLRVIPLPQAGSPGS
jgi:hypothetical protein